MGTSSAWTPERRAKQAAAIRKWQPWDKSTGPTTAEGKRRASQNAKLPPKSPELLKLQKRLQAAKKGFVRGLRRSRCSKGTEV
jgi:hypothetical protein